MNNLNKSNLADKIILYGYPQNATLAELYKFLYLRENSEKTEQIFTTMLVGLENLDQDIAKKNFKNNLFKDIDNLIMDDKNRTQDLISEDYKIEPDTFLFHRRFYLDILDNIKNTLNSTNIFKYDESKLIEIRRISETFSQSTTFQQHLKRVKNVADLVDQFKNSVTYDTNQSSYLESLIKEIKTKSQEYLQTKNFNPQQEVSSILKTIVDMDMADIIVNMCLDKDKFCQQAEELSKQFGETIYINNNNISEQTRQQAKERIRDFVNSCRNEYIYDMGNVKDKKYETLRKINNNDMTSLIKYISWLDESVYISESLIISILKKLCINSKHLKSFNTYNSWFNDKISQKGVFESIISIFGSETKNNINLCQQLYYFDNEDKIKPFVPSEKFEGFLKKIIEQYKNYNDKMINMRKSYREKEKIDTQIKEGQSRSSMYTVLENNFKEELQKLKRDSDFNDYPLIKNYQNISGGNMYDFGYNVLGDVGHRFYLNPYRDPFVMANNIARSSMRALDFINDKRSIVGIDPGRPRITVSQDQFNTEPQRLARIKIQPSTFLGGSLFGFVPRNRLMLRNQVGTMRYLKRVDEKDKKILNIFIVLNAIGKLVKTFVKEDGLSMKDILKTFDSKLEEAYKENKDQNEVQHKKWENVDTTDKDVLERKDIGKDVNEMRKRVTNVADSIQNLLK